MHKKEQTDIDLPICLLSDAVFTGYRLFFYGDLFHIVVSGAVFCNSGLEHTDTVAVASGLDNDRVFLYAEHSADDAADSNYLISDLDIFAHFLFFLCALFFRTNEKKIENNDHSGEG